ncbi:hypothetical protein ACWGR4_30575 [Embleya sp. NPDC055664]
MDTIPRGDGVGRSARTMRTTLTCDAPLVALHLSEQGIPPICVLSHPGRRAADRAATALLRKRTAHLCLGPWRGDPIETEITTDEDRVWFNWPAPGVESLCRASASVLRGRALLYIDSYPWLEAAALRVVAAARPSGVVVVNLGRVDPVDASASLRRWTIRLPQASVVAQVCVPDLTSESARRAAVDAILRGTGCAHAVVTSGAEGLGTAGPDGFHWWRPPFEGRNDTSGAGAAVAAALVGSIGEQGLRWDADTAATLAAAGAGQCRVNGPLPASVSGIVESFASLGSE